MKPTDAISPHCSQIFVARGVRVLSVLGAELKPRCGLKLMQFLGIDIGGTKTAVCIGDETGEISQSRRIPTQSVEGPERAISRMIDLTHSVLNEADITIDDISAIGLSAPGPVSVQRGLLIAPPNMPGWIDVPLVNIFQEKLGKPVYMNNDANACALAEYLFGGSRGIQNIVYLTMSTGLGAGFVSGGKIIQGSTDLAGEVGHHVLDIHGPPCPCGQRGCLEIYCGGKNVADRLRKKITEEKIETAILDEAGGDPEKISFQSFITAIRKKDSFALEAWDEYLERLSQGIGTIIQFMNPQVIIMGTIGIHAGDLIIPEVYRRLPKYAWKIGIDACRIEPSKLGSKIGDLSALALAIQGIGIHAG